VPRRETSEQMAGRQPRCHPRGVFCRAQRIVHGSGVPVFRKPRPANDHPDAAGRAAVWHQAPAGAGPSTVHVWELGGAVTAPI